MAQTFGPFYGTKKAAMARYCVVTRHGEFCGGKLVRLEGELMYSTAATAERFGDDAWMVTAEFRPATEEEQKAAERAAKEARISALLNLIGGDWKNSTGSAMHQQMIDEYRSLRAELEATNA